ncbi:MAG: hypothetical protein JWM99_3589 [Verrucomicrobiales bacterium]|nr:hypothetical protein [Verrucomicrobiales bacterium]
MGSASKPSVDTRPAEGHSLTPVRGGLKLRWLNIADSFLSFVVLWIAIKGSLGANGVLCE